MGDMTGDVIGDVIGGKVLDTSALLDVALGKTEYARTVATVAVEQGIVLAVPSVALMAAWAKVPVHTHRALDLLVRLPVTVVVPLGEDGAKDAGLAGSPVDGAPLDAVHVAWSAARRGWPVVTGEPGPLLAIDPWLEIERLPY